MKWFDNWFANKCRRVLEIDHPEEDDWAEPPSMQSMKYNNTTTALVSSKSIRKLNRRLDSDNMDLPEGGLNIQVKSAIGGKIVIFRSYDERNDRNCYSTYLIPDSESFQESLGKIITVESLKL